MDKEQWKLNGKCDICRRKKYRSKPCRPKQNRNTVELGYVIANAMEKILNKGGSD